MLLLPSPLSVGSASSTTAVFVGPEIVVDGVRAIRGEKYNAVLMMLVVASTDFVFGGIGDVSMAVADAVPRIIGAVKPWTTFHSPLDNASRPMRKYAIERR